MVDDDEAFEMLLPRLIQEANSPVSFRFVYDGEEAINYLSGIGEFADREKHPFPKMVLLDLKMPKVNGFEVLEWKQKQPHLAALPVVVWSSSDLPIDKERAATLGASDYIVKPMFGHGLVEAIDRIYKSLTEARIRSVQNSH